MGERAIQRWLARPRRRRTPIAWDELAALAPGDRAALGSLYALRASEEHTAGLAFTELADELAAHGAAAELVTAVRRVVADEDHHHDLCRRAATALGARDIDAAPRIVRSDKRYPLRERTALVLVTSLCVAESWSAAVFADELARATHPVVRAIETEILADEVTHGRLGFAWLEDTWMTLPYSTRLLVEHTLAPVLRDLEQRQPARRRALLLRTMTERILPRLDRAGMRATRAWDRRHTA